ncbi:HNH endonuclease [Hyphomicrobium sp. DY-1]|uniref:HNH endonuclease n=1 Tax=Hyphomicrobium sp. DY-1 TaxID=3075650 RepID=UPI0039C3F15B
MHLPRWQKYGDPLAGETFKGEVTQFLLEVAIPYRGDDCLPWPFGHNGNGYGTAQPEGERIFAHRYVCEAAHGPPPPDRNFALHSCGNGHLGCVNPSHLRWGTQQENAEDMVAHGNSPRGERHGMAKLTKDQVRTIRRLVGHASYRSIASRFSVSPRAISDIATRKTWSWLE